jgi:hypothetical protein
MSQAFHVLQDPAIEAVLDRLHREADGQFKQLLWVN